jgi:hypothetical protein
MKKVLDFLKRLFARLFGKKKQIEPVIKWADKYLPIAPHFKHDTHSKRPYYLKAELMEAAQAKRDMRAKKRLEAAKKGAMQILTGRG